MDYIGPYVHSRTIRTNTGFKYYSVTGKTENKRPYKPEEALRRAEEHAENFIYNRLKQVEKLSKLMKRPPLFVCPYDAELFGHWWFEGPLWLEFAIRKLHEQNCGMTLITPGEYLEKYPDNQTITPSYSSWGNKGYGEVWLDPSNDWIYRHLFKAIERMQELAERFPDESGLKERILNQAARELLLGQASDWPFILKTGTSVGYANRRIREHIFNFSQIYNALFHNNVKTEWITELEKRNNIFHYMDYRIFRTTPQDVALQR